MVETRRLPSEAYKPINIPDYVDVSGVDVLFKALAFRGNIILAGPPGVGKSLAIQNYCAKTDTPVITVDCSEDIRRSNLIGNFVLQGNETPFILGPICTAFEVANEVGQAVLLFEECNALTPQMQKTINPITDFRRHIDVPEIEKVFRLKEGAKLWVVGTMNFTVHGGVYALNADLRSRFRFKTFDYPNAVDEKRIISSQVNAKELRQDVIVNCITLAKETRQKVFDYVLSTRDLVQLIEDIRDIGVLQALTLLCGKFEGEDGVSIRKRIESIFAITL